MDYTKEVIQLRQLIPVGIKQAEKLLQTTNGNVEEAKQIHALQMTELFMQKTGASSEQAKKHLEASAYNMGLAMHTYEQEIYTVTELCFMKNKNKVGVLSALLYAIEEKYNTTSWLGWLKDMPKLNPAEYTFTILMQWRNYEGWEGDLSISPVIAKELHKLDLNWLSPLYDKTVQRCEELSGTGKYICHEKEYKILYDVYLAREEEIVDALYSFVKENMKEFP